MERRPFTGALTAIVSPFDAENQLDLGAFRKILESQKRAGMNGVVVCGTTGECPTLRLEEKILLVETALTYQDDSFSVYVGTGTNSTETTIANMHELTGIKVQGHSARGIMVVVPYYNKPNQAGLGLHFSAVAQAFPNTSLCLYNVPGRTSCNLAPETFASLAKSHSNIVAIKEAAGDVLTMTRLSLELKAAKIDQSISILSGDDATFPASLITGANGVISVVSHVAPRCFSGLLKARQEGNLEKIQMLNMALYPLATGLFCAPNPAPVKYALSTLGLCRADVRLPLAPLSSGEQHQVERALEQARLLGATIL